jgi:hypothetical protein
VWRNRPIRYLILCGAALIAAIVVGTTREIREIVDVLESWEAAN